MILLLEIKMNKFELLMKLLKTKDGRFEIAKRMISPERCPGIGYRRCLGCNCTFKVANGSKEEYCSEICWLESNE
jgi:hypothetical protein